MDEPSAQLHDELRCATREALARRRPLLHHLNDDSSWLLQLPRPVAAVRRGIRAYYNILLDPWLKGGQSDVASWFSQQFHATPSAVQSIAELEELICELESLAYDKSIFSDHCHKETLMAVAPDVPVFAAVEAAKLIDSWKHFRTVVPLRSFGADGDTDWRTFSEPPLPEWIGISRVLSPSDALYYHSAVMITWNSGTSGDTAGSSKNGTSMGSRRDSYSPLDRDENEDSAEAVLYTPHGVNSQGLRVVPGATPRITTLAFLHGLHNVRLATWDRTALQLNLGASNGLKAQTVLKSRYWISTHDEVKTGRGLVGFFIKRDVQSVKEALARHREQRKANLRGASRREEDEVLLSLEDTKWLNLRNGESRALL